MFVAARCFSINKDHEDIIAGSTSFAASPGFQEFINTGLLGAVVTTILGCLIWRIFASNFPLAFLSNPIIYVIIRICLALEATGLCASSWVLGKIHKDLVGYQPDAVRLEGAPKQVTRMDKDIEFTIDFVKYIYSLALLAFSVTTVMAAIGTEQTSAADNGIPVGVAIPLFWVLIIWLAIIEGGQGALIGLIPTPKADYAQSHPISHKCTVLAHEGDNMERFIVGRQFLVVLQIFVINLCGSAIGGASVLNFNSLTANIFLANGVAMILTTIVLGQLTSQVNASYCMLDFINNYFMLFSTYVSLAIEASGLLHAAYLVQNVASLVSGKPIETNEPPRNGMQNALFWGRVLFSLAVLGFSLAIVIDALFKGWTGMWDGVPPVAALFIVIIVLCFVGIMEGMQIAAFAVVKVRWSEE
jgi:hypothetical protein